MTVLSVVGTVVPNDGIIRSAVGDTAAILLSVVEGVGAVVVGRVGATAAVGCRIIGKQTAVELCEVAAATQVLRNIARESALIGRALGQACAVLSGIVFHSRESQGSRVSTTTRGGMVVLN